MDPINSLVVAKKVCWEAPYYAHQKPTELAAMLDYVHKKQPKTIVEIGTYLGGTAYALQQAAPDAVLICVDDDSMPKDKDGIDYNISFADQLKAIDVNAVAIKGDSRVFSTFESVSHITPNGVDFLFIDGNHSYEAVKTDWELYKLLVSKTGTVCFHDIAPNVASHGSDLLWKELKEDEQYNCVEIFHKPLTWGGIGLLTRKD